MNFVVERIGKIRRADVAIDGVTVIAGPNGSGKSTVGRALMTWFSALRQMPSKLTDERLKSAREAVDKVLSAHGLPMLGDVFSAHDRDAPTIWWRPETWRDAKSIADILIGMPIYFLAERSVTEDAEEIVAIAPEIDRVLEEVQARDISYYQPSIVEESFETALGKGFTPPSVAPCRSSVKAEFDASTSSVAVFEDGKVIQCQSVPSDKVPLVFYFEPVHLLDLYAKPRGPRGPYDFRLSATRRYLAPDADWSRFLFDEVDRSGWSVERKKRQEEIEAELDRLLEVMRGQLEKRERELLFVDKDASVRVPVLNAASGIKTMSAIERGIRAGVIQPGCLLIVDEPESNLHPQWQIEFAHFLVNLNARFGMRFLLNTHSPFFLKAVEVFAREEGCGPSTHFYHMEKAPDDFGYSTKELKDGTNEIFKTYFDAMNDLISR